MQMIWLAWMGMLGCGEDDTIATVDDVGGWAELEGLGVLGWTAGGSIYLCGVGDAVVESRWFISDGGDAWVSADGAWTMQRDGDDVTMQSPKDAWDGVLTAFDDGGLYDASPESCRSGAVVFNGGVVGSWCDLSGAFLQVEPIDTVIGSPESFEATLIADPSYIFTFQQLQ
ncbi:MAG: hypothetical protein ACI8RZ_000818 [Myxococcota bacterium]